MKQSVERDACDTMCLFAYINLEFLLVDMKCCLKNHRDSNSRPVHLGLHYFQVSGATFLIHSQGS